MLLCRLHAQTVGECAPLLRDVILEQLHDLKEEEYVNTTAGQQETESEGMRDKDAAEGMNLGIFAAEHAHSHAHSHARIFFSYGDCCQGC